MKKIIITAFILSFFPLVASASEMGDLINAYRAEQNLPAVVELPALCVINDIRLNQIVPDYSHNGFYAMTNLLKQYGSWYENLAQEGTKIRGTSGVFEAWKKSPTHNKNLLSPMQFVCIKNSASLWSLIGWKPKIK